MSKSSLPVGLPSPQDLPLPNDRKASAENEEFWTVRKPLLLRDDPIAWREVDETRRPGLHRIADDILKDDAEAHSVVNVTFAKLRLNLARLDPAIGIDSWLKKVCRNEALGELRRRKATIREPEQSKLIVLDGPESDVSDLGLSPGERAELSEVRDAVDQLPEPRRTIIKLRYYEDLTLQEIADVLGMAVSTVHKHHGIALLELAQILASDYGEGRDS